MRKVIIIALCVLASSFIMVRGFGDAEAQGVCNSHSIEGVWYTYPHPVTGVGPMIWVVTMTTGSKGFLTVDTGGIPPDLNFGGYGALVEGAVTLTTWYGPVKRTGANSFEYNLVAFCLGENGTALGILKISGWFQLDQSCDSGTYNSRLAVFTGDQDPYGDESPFYCFDYQSEPYSFIRMPLDPPCDP